VGTARTAAAAEQLGLAAWAAYADAMHAQLERREGAQTLADAVHDAAAAKRARLAAPAVTAADLPPLDVTGLCASFAAPTSEEGAPARFFSLPPKPAAAGSAPAAAAGPRGGFAAASSMLNGGSGGSGGGAALGAPISRPYGRPAPAAPSAAARLPSPALYAGKTPARYRRGGGRLGGDDGDDDENEPENGDGPVYGDDEPAAGRAGAGGPPGFLTAREQLAIDASKPGRGRGPGGGDPHASMRAPSAPRTLGGRPTGGRGRFVSPVANRPPPATVSEEEAIKAEYRYVRDGMLWRSSVAP